MDGDERRAYVEQTWYRRKLDGPRRYETIRLVHVVAPAERWEVYTSGRDAVMSDHANRSTALAEVARIVGDAWVVTPVRQRRPAAVGR